MNKKLQSLLSQLPLFLMLGIGIAFAIGMLIIFFYVFIWGALIGGIIWLVFCIKNYFFPTKQRRPQKGRIIEHDDNNR